MKYFSRSCRIVLLLLSFILTVQEIYADGADKATSSDATKQGEINAKTLPGSLIIDKVKNLVKSIENLTLFRSMKYEQPQTGKENEGLASYSYGGEPNQEMYNKNLPGKYFRGNRK